MSEKRLKSLKRYSEKSYNSAFVREEKKLMVTALNRTKGCLFKAWRLNCPKRQIYYTIESYYRAVLRHDLKIDRFVSNEEAEIRLSQEVA